MFLGFKRKPIGKVFAEENKIAGGKRKRGESDVVENFLLSFENSSSTKNVSALASEWPAVNEQVRTDFSLIACKLREAFLTLKNKLKVAGAKVSQSHKIG